MCNWMQIPRPLYRIFLVLLLYIALNSILNIFESGDITNNLAPFYFLDDSLRLGIDKQYCDGHCRFLVPAITQGQETQNQMQLRRLASLAQTLGRTLVLPNVGNSMAGICQEHDFTHYYSADWANDFSWPSGNMPILRDDFLDWLEKRTSENLTATVGNVVLLDPILLSNSPPNTMTCLDNYLHRGREDLILDNVNALQDIIQAEKSNPVEVLSVHHWAFESYFRNPSIDMDVKYNERLVDYVDQLISTRLGNHYWVVYWKTEGINQGFTECAQSLVQMLKTTAKYTGAPIPPIVFVSDYYQRFTINELEHRMKYYNKPMADPIDHPNSNTYIEISLPRQLHRAIKYLYTKQDLHVTSTKPSVGGMPRQWKLLHIDETISRHDRAIKGIIDKLIAIRADRLFSGKPSQCALRSTYAAGIIRERMRTIQDPKKVVQYFGRKK